MVYNVVVMLTVMAAVLELSFGSPIWLSMTTALILCVLMMEKWALLKLWNQWEDSMTRKMDK